MTVEELDNRISARELLEWKAYDQLEPIGAAGSNAFYIGFAIVACTVANAHRNPKSKAYEVSDFMPKFERKEQSAGEMIQIAQVITAAQAAYVQQGGE